MKRTGMKFLFVLMVFFPASAFALGLGLYGAAGRGDANIDGSYTAGSSSYSRSFDQNSGYLGYGLVFDSAVAEKDTFNYRVNIGRERLTFVDDYGPDLKLNGFVLDQDFGYAFMRKRRIRLWAGPEVRLAWFRDSQYETSGFRTFKTKYSFVGAGIGPVLGTNLNFGRSFTLAFKLGYLWTYLDGTEKISDDTAASYPEIHYKAEDTHTFFNIAVIFRFDDVYAGKPKAVTGEVLK